MRAWRLCKARHKSLDGIGGELAEGRWHAKGQRIVYAASTPSLALLEILVHLDLSPDLLPDDYVLTEIEIPNDASFERIAADSLAPGWDALDGTIARALGSRWLESEASAVLLVPSAILPEEGNVLINSRHPDAGRIRMTADRPFRFDPRLLKEGGG